MDDQADAIAFLAAGAGLDLAGDKVTRIDTHASSVFLIADRAFKLKRAVRYSYLDYSTLERREEACRAELEINRRIAPALYLGVRAIARAASGAVGFDGGEEILDWVVEMRRFDTEMLFDRLATRGELSAAMMRALADEVAAFHANAERARDGIGGDLARVVADTVANLRAAGDALDQDAVARLDQAARAALSAQTSLLERRRRDGKVRRCHGDLHLGNICLIDGKPTLFDAIEFSVELATIDVLYDLAFLVMDLVHRRLGGHASLVLNRYLDLARDDEGMAAMTLFLSARAAIRALVTNTAAALAGDEKQRQAKRDEARQYLALAEAVLAPAKPRVIAIGGRSGSGKSTVAQALAPDLSPVPGARILRSDVMRKTMLDLAPETKLPDSTYTRAMGRQVYARMEHEAARLIGAGVSVILDATFLDPRERQEAELMATNAGVPFTGIWLEAPGEVMAARLDERRGDASDATAAVLDRQMRGELGAMTWRRVESGGSLPRVLAAVRRAAGLTETPISPRMGRGGARGERI